MVVEHSPAHPATHFAHSAEAVILVHILNELRAIHEHMDADEQTRTITEYAHTAFHDANTSHIRAKVMQAYTATRPDDAPVSGEAPAAAPPKPKRAAPSKKEGDDAPDR